MHDTSPDGLLEQLQINLSENESHEESATDTKSAIGAMRSEDWADVPMESSTSSQFTREINHELSRLSSVIEPQQKHHWSTQRLSELAFQERALLKRENEQLRVRVGDLEGKLQVSQSLLSDKDEALSSIQQELQDAVSRLQTDPTANRIQNSRHQRVKSIDLQYLNPEQIARMIVKSKVKEASAKRKLRVASRVELQLRDLLREKSEKLSKLGQSNTAAHTWRVENRSRTPEKSVSCNCTENIKQKLVLVGDYQAMHNKIAEQELQILELERRLAEELAGRGQDDVDIQQLFDKLAEGTIADFFFLILIYIF